MTDILNTNELDELMEEAKEAERKLNELIKERGQALLAGLFKWVFDNSDVICIHWEQYTTYFNDGEECTLWYEYESDNWNPNGFYYKPSLYNSKVYPKPEWANEKNWDVISRFSKKFRELSNVLERVFGDHVSITVTRKDDGSIEFESEHTEHE